ncbi:hypothetical protein AVEN_206808-1 [Araneus ventricosus]|uniref:Uncharacterized protein n=1 Tax=Araneus ventricosus TaxID=182803 RepID=A0A4Y2C5Q8_ARAVE|nr:hypothetical protein AVEN_206808-1 [Araneus ventricosus]
MRSCRISKQILVPLVDTEMVVWFLGPISNGGSYPEEEFVNWKLQFEKDSQSSFVIRNSWVKKEPGKKLSYYICHRSGSFKPKGERIRHMKASGSIKSGSTCPAVMNVTAVTLDGIVEINVRYRSVHVGHDLEIGKLQLSKNERVDLAASLPAAWYSCGENIR